MEKTKDEQRQDISEGTKDEEIYSEQGREAMVDDDELSPAEAGFMEGAEGRGQEASCAHCGKILGDKEDGVFESKVDGKNLFFCSEHCAEKGKR